MRTKDQIQEKDVCPSKILLLSAILLAKRNYLELLDVRVSIKIHDPHSRTNWMKSEYLYLIVKLQKPQDLRLVVFLLKWFI